MHRNTTLVGAAFATALGVLCVPHPAFAQADFRPDIPVPPYNPYPPLPGFTPAQHSPTRCTAEAIQGSTRSCDDFWSLFR